MSDVPPRLPFTGWIVAFLLAAAVIIGLYVQFGGRPTPEAATKLEHYGPAPEFQLTAQDGKTVTNKDLLDKIWVANFIFTRCQGPCPVMSSRMADLDRKSAAQPDVQLISVTVDPAYDTPPILQEYAERLGAKPDKWRFLTGPPDKVAEIIQKGFFLPLGKEDGVPAHSTKFVLIDRAGQMRAFEDGSNPQVAANLMKDIKTLLAEQPSQP